MNNPYPVAIFALTFLAICVAKVHAGELDKTGTQWAPYLEWSITNSSWSGNPFDLIATATFVHGSSGEKRITQMFYDENDTWKFRFTGTRKGTWSVTTSSSDSDLAGKSGTITIKPNPDPLIKGFITHRGNKFARMSGEGELEGFLPMVFMNYHGHDSHDVPFFGLYDTALVEAYVQDAFDHGCNGLFSGYLGAHWFEYASAAYKNNTPENPDPFTFRGLELMVTTAHRRGGFVYIWAWGDQSRKWTPVGVGGINKVPDRRLQRYIAARLGPLPGWMMGYGFDLHEWVAQPQLQSWADYVSDHLGWPHMLASRAFNISGPLTMNSYSSFDRSGEELSTTAYGPADYNEVASDFDSDEARPHFYTERHSYLRSGYNLDMDGTRRLMWWEAMAGGVGGWYGFYPSSTYPYPNPEQMNTHLQFWHIKKRYRLDMARANNLSSDGNTRVLKSGSDRVIFYREGASSIQMDLSGIGCTRQAVAVDAKKAYAEIRIGNLSKSSQTWNAPYRSDWVIAVGDFG